MKRRRSEVLGRFYATYHEANQRHFAGLLPTVPIYLRAAGHGTTFGFLWCDDHTGAPRYIVMAERHALSDSWPKVRDTILHEMVHVWQATQGWKVNHGPEFRAKAKQLGVEPRAAC